MMEFLFSLFFIPFFDHFEIHSFLTSQNTHEEYIDVSYHYYNIILWYWKRFDQRKLRIELQSQPAGCEFYNQLIFLETKRKNFRKERTINEPGMLFGRFCGIIIFYLVFIIQETILNIQIELKIEFKEVDHPN